MKLFFSVLFALLILLSAPGLSAQELIKRTLTSGVCYAGNKTTRVFVPPPEDFFKKAGRKGGAEITLFSSGFTPQVNDAVNYAVSILETLLPDNVKITLLASYTRIATEGVLANASVSGYIGGWAIDALNPLAYYPVTIAEKVLGRELNSGNEADIILNINSSVNWYTGTDGNTPALQYDMVTVVLHELCHGLGFFDSMNTEGTVGYYGGDGIPVIYDTFVENFQGQRLTDTLIFTNPSTDLKREFTGDQLFFKGPLIMNYSSGVRPKLYAPGSFDSGSSISHLDESTYDDPAFSLMTPFIDRSEAIHDPGKFTMSILGDLGWINTRIEHVPPIDSEDHLTEITVSVAILSDTLYNRNKVGVVYSADNFVTFDTILLSSPLSDNNFNASLPVTSYGQEVQYYFFVEDIFKRLYRSPSLMEVFRYRVYIGTDTVKPILAHAKPDYYFSRVDSIRFRVLAIDNIGVDTVFAEYRVNDGPSAFIGLYSSGEQEYKNAFRAKGLNLSEGDTLKYRFFAFDKALTPNIGKLPSEGYFSVKIEPIYSVVDSYTTDFTDAWDDFFNVAFSVTTPPDFSSPGLHSSHPYESPEVSGDSINYTSLLRYPVKFDGSGMIFSFRELVLVEPGEEGSVYGTDDFFDYVIVEGSRDFGNKWFSLIDGYDSRYYEPWETAYNSSVTGMNSNFQGRESMMLQRTFFPRPSDNIFAGDTLMIRFRLFSDPFANGWGWGIDDLHIGPLYNRVEKVVQGSLIAFPNPGDGRLTIRNIQGVIFKPLKYSVYNFSGICVRSEAIKTSSEFEIDISSHPAGLYIILIHSEDGISKIKYILKK